MRPGTSNTWAKAMFFAGLWVLAATLLLAAAGGAVWWLSLGGDRTAFVVSVGLIATSPAWLGAIPYAAARVHRSGRVAVIICFGFVFLMAAAIVGRLVLV